MTTYNSTKFNFDITTSTKYQFEIRTHLYCTFEFFLTCSNFKFKIKISNLTTTEKIVIPGLRNSLPSYTYLIHI